MTNSDVFAVTASWDKPGGYQAGQTITGTIAGNDVLTTTSVVNAGPVTVPIVAADGATSTVSLPSVPVTIITTTPESVVIDTTKPIVDSGTPPRTWVVAANKLSISAAA